ncbi:Signal transduction histidine kinase CheA [gamma proteobacterium IMCC2047]|nr:Signal transduction histidine kinase CheA [gamma proteobacterium IMCC2047]
MLNLVGELVITQSMLGRFKKEFKVSDLSDLRDGLAQLESNTRELQESAMQIRMLPIKVAFSRFTRLVRDLSRNLGKKVRLELLGEQTELDKTVLEKIGDPLVHLVRNSLDHGIETVEKRLAAGKPAEGLLRLSAYHEAGNIVIEITDDGAGLNRDKILSKAIERGLVSEDEQLSDERIYMLIFQAGFSTADQVSDLSGRGVGMDVVRRNIQDLGGRIDIQSEVGQGSTITIRLPLTLAILDGQLVRVGEETYIVPLLSIVESVFINPERVNVVANNQMLYRLRDDFLPITDLRPICGGYYRNMSLDVQELNDKLLVVIETAGKRYGIVVDDLEDQQQLFIKALENNYRQVSGLAGATILGDGSVALILDIPSLAQRCFSDIDDSDQQATA